MTRSVTIVNTSNWDGEDWIVKQRFGPNKWDETTIKPGEAIRSMLGSPNWEVQVEAVESSYAETVQVVWRPAGVSLRDIGVGTYPRVDKG